MSKAFVLATIDLSDLASTHELREKLMEVRGVVGVYLVYGSYDLIVEVESESPETLKDIVFNRIRAFAPVKSTLTLTVV
jgi:DNA-binding Lrp family transcriptional regulator